MAMSPSSRLMDLRRSRSASDDGSTGAAGPVVSSRRLRLEDLSNPPTAAELRQYSDANMHDLPPTYKREPENRVYVVRGLRLESVKHVGFDMDHTICEYKSPQYEALQYRLIVNRLVAMGYPESIRTLSYDASFPIRGLCLDTKLGNLLKLDQYGTILAATHGRRRLTTAEKYPSKFINLAKVGSGRRFHLYDTLFSMPEICLYADLISLFESEMESSELGIDDEKLSLSFEALFIDLRAAVDHIHYSGELKDATTADLEMYVEPAPRLADLLLRFRTKAKVFLLTNSPYAYTNIIMDYLLAPSYTADYPNWRSFFDVAIVSARKPLFFGKGTALREVEVATGNLKLHRITAFEDGAVYHGGSLSTFCELTGARGPDVLYIGDHIFGDVIKSKKNSGWRTLLVVRELVDELNSFRNSTSEFVHLANLEFMLAEIYRGLDSSAVNPPNVKDIHAEIRATRFADLYASSVTNIIHYPMFYAFRTQAALMPHERGAMQGGDDAHDMAQPSLAVDSDSDDLNISGSVHALDSSMETLAQRKRTLRRASSDDDDDDDDMQSRSDHHHPPCGSPDEAGGPILAGNSDNDDSDDDA
ncbi:cytosolic purine 5'-nucleotidase [Thecamonas trahens ATCC 50062]|uniref:Cytosolic purine 5'-nucleotidase n=1 Tax=Thecamonas trahens ATCC 50062 TaxID=461836 RepID=A0A0L0DN01_THETB|nr:cytosolic purine 5'-nucleotidase [Thecamonas trahens ATCC 50062]KNC52793.1 cytosolic purine 5'-nucleotidase [Thecamonas trahens ATCC 50062]|eukprot:XP_013755103.1 cytosolic purine 5'-nucleotidase [Thecamonas trahens ATCC 50062]